MERVDLVYKTIPEDATTIDRLWPNQLLNKDSRIRRDLSLALEYGCLENELMDFLLDHYEQDIPSELIVGKKYEMKYNRSVLKRDENPIVYRIRKVLEAISLLRKRNTPEAKQEKALKMAEILEYIKDSEESSDFTKNIETKEFQIPNIAQGWKIISKKKNSRFSAFSESVSIAFDSEKGRYLVATKDILAGDLIGIEEGLSTLLYPEKMNNTISHCQHCFKFTKCPLPCEVCCSVVFCSIRCRQLASKSYHKYECEMRIYEIIPLESLEMAPFFLVLRTVTQESLQFFIDHRESFEQFLNVEEPIHPFDGQNKECLKHMDMMNLVTHMNNIPEDKSMKCAVISVYILRCLQHGKYFKNHVPQRKKGDRTLHQHEYIMLRIIHHLVFVQLHNSQPINKLITEPGKFSWERMGISLNTNIALTNHNCDPNAFIFHLDKHVLLLASTHIKEGEEISISYVPTYLYLNIEKREYRLLKNFEFQCECRACFEKWKLVDDIPDILPRIPNFEQERCFVVRHGDKKQICDEINGARWMADFGLNSDSFEVAQEALDTLCQSLITHVRKPHLHFVEASELVEKLIISRYIGFTMTELAKIEAEAAIKVTKGTSKQIAETDEISQPLQKSKPNTEITNLKNRHHKRELNSNSTDTPEETEKMGTSKLIKAFQEQKEKSSSPLLPARSRSPTLRMFSSPEKSGEKKRSVLERFDDSKLKTVSYQALQDVKKAKRDLVESMKRFPAKTDMAERMAAFQSNEKEIPQRAKSKEKTEIKAETTKKEEMKENNAPPTPNSQLPVNKKQKGNIKTLETISEERKAFMEKDDQVQKRIIIREEKLEILKEKSLKKDSELTAKELELQKLRERTRLLMQKAKEKEDNFSKEEKEFQSSLEKGSKDGKSRLDKILAKANEKANAMKEEMRKKRASEDEDNLLSFLRKSHKKGDSIYSFIEEDKKEPVPNKEETTTAQEAQKSFKILTTISDEVSTAGASANFYKPTTSMDIKKAVQKSIDSKQNVVKHLKRVETIPILKKHEENGISANTLNINNSEIQPTDAKHLYSNGQQKETCKVSSINFYLPTSPRPNRAVQKNKPQTSKSADLEKALNNKKMQCKFQIGGDDSETEANEEITNSFQNNSEPVHYSERWSMSPVSQDENERQSRSKLRPLDKPPIIINGKIHSPKRNESKHEYGKLSRRKSLSDNCLISKSKQVNANGTSERDLDAFGIPKIPRQKRSISLMRETFIKRPLIETSTSKEKQRRISHETRTSSAAEFKSLFENGSASSRNSRSSTPCRPIQVDPEHLSKIKTKFEEIQTDNLKLPFPNYRVKPPRPQGRPPPPPRI